MRDLLKNANGVKELMQDIFSENKVYILFGNLMLFKG